MDCPRASDSGGERSSRSIPTEVRPSTLPRDTAHLNPVRDPADVLTPCGLLCVVEEIRTGDAVVLSIDPTILVMGNLDVVDLIAEYYRERQVHILLGTFWSLSDRPDIVTANLARCAAQHPNFRVTLLVNDAVDLVAARELALPAELVNQAAFLDETIYDIMPGVEQRFAAVYNARLAWYKRHELARATAGLKLIVIGADPETCGQLTELLPGCTIAQCRDSSIVWLSACEVAWHLNTARCGLCLSQAEGAMLASAEYLLCGLPVVTTRNRGGRDWLFAHDYAFYCEDDPAAVAAMVTRVSQAEISRQLVRESAVEKIRRERLVLFKLMECLFTEHGQPMRRYAPEFASRFYDKMNYWGRPIQHLLV